MQAENIHYSSAKYAQEAWQAGARRGNSNCWFFARPGNMDMRTGTDRRKTNPFGKSGPWLTTGKMGGLVITDRRKSTGRRTTDSQQGAGLSTSTE